MNRKLTILAILTAVSWTPRCARAQAEVCPQYVIPFVMRDARGEMVHKFSRDDLELKLDGAPQGIDKIDRHGHSRRIVILLDASGSMRGFENEVPWGRALESARLLASFSEGRARLALLIFNAKISEEIGFGGDNSAVIKRLGELEKDQAFLNHSVNGTTSLYDAMERAMELLGQSASTDELFVASDGADTHSRLSLKELQRRLADSRVRVFVALLELPLGNRNRTPEELNAGQISSELGEQTGGGIMYVGPTEIGLGFETHPRPTSAEGLRMFFEGMFENEVLQFSPSNQDLKKRNLKVTPSISARERLKGAQFFYPRKLYACSSTQGATGTR